jgi:hypothetical protein
VATWEWEKKDDCPPALWGLSFVESSSSLGLSPLHSICHTHPTPHYLVDCHDAPTFALSFTVRHDHIDKKVVSMLCSVRLLLLISFSFRFLGPLIRVFLCTSAVVSNLAQTLTA